MRIKRLEVLGFKSFMDKAVFQFDVPLTSIVGPNGCGKSNVVDALKWVTGELSSKELRGKSMDDLIFAGSELRPPTNLMEVSLVLDNAEKKAPAQFADYEEISVARRLFRDGTSEYYLNKVECRLRDIVDLFLDTGIGASSYSIIEQGRVGALISSRPEDKRLIIEEAAGITKYKHRRKSAERKMEFTQQNLLRVNDVLGELKRQIGSLERQAKKAEKYKAIREEVKTLDLAILAREYHEVQEQLNVLEDKLERSNEEYTALEHDLAIRDSDLDQFRISVMSSEDDLKRKQEALYARKTELSNLEHKISTLKRDISFAQDLAEKEKSEAITLTQNIEILGEKIATLESEKNLVSQNQEGMASEFASVMQKSAMAESVVKDLEDKIHSQKTSLVEIASKLGALEKQFSHSNDQIARLQEHIRTRESALENAKTDQVKQQKQLKIDEDQLAEIQQLRFSFEEAIRTTEEKLHDITLEKDVLAKRLNECSSALEAKKSRAGALKDFIDGFKAFGEAVQSILKNKDQHSGFRGVLSDVVETENGFERAVQAAMDEYLQTMVVKSQDDLFDLVGYLESEKKGRAGLISLDTVSVPHTRGEVEVEGTLGRITQFFSQKDFPEIDLSKIFQNVFVVNNVKDALALLRQNTHASYVTLNGEFVNSFGKVVGGHGQSDRGVLEIKNELKTLMLAIDEAQIEKVALGEQLVGKERDIELHKAALKQARQSAQSEAENLRDLEHRVLKQTERIKYDTDVIGRLHKEIENLKSECIAIQERLVSDESSLLELQTVKQQFESKLEDDMVRLVSAKTDLSAWYEKVSGLRVQEASVRERILSYEREILSAQQQLNDASVKKAKLSQSYEERFAFASSESNRVQEFEVQWRESASYVESEEMVVQESKTIYDQQLSELHELETSLKSVRQHRDEQHNLLSDLKFQFQDMSNKRSRLEDQTSERHMLAIASIYDEHKDRLMDSEQLTLSKEALSNLRRQLEQLGDVNIGAIEELAEVRERHEFTTAQRDDLESTLVGLKEAISKLNETTVEKFSETFKEVNEKFQYLFPRMFRGGKAKLVLTNEEDLLESGVDIVAQPPGKKLQNLNLLSGGEKALTAISLIFAIFQHKAPPFCVLDEVDAPLDEANVSRFSEMVKEMSSNTQFIVITHNKTTMEVAENLYGVTMEEPGVSRLVSVRVKSVIQEDEMPQASVA